MREINTLDIKNKIKELAIKANIEVNDDLKVRLQEVKELEDSEVSKSILETMLTNFDLAKEKDLPICQDTGMAIIFLEIGQDVHLVGPYLEDMINEGVREGYKEGYLRKSVVSDPIDRINTTDNTPAIIHSKIVPGENIKITFMAKGFGSENTSQLKMLKPSDGIEGVKAFINEAIEAAIPNGCAPLVVGVGIGGNFETSALLSKKALTVPIGKRNSNSFYADLENELITTANNTGIGPMGIGGSQSVLDVHVLSEPTHIAGLPVAVNICCYVDRVKNLEL